MLIMSGCIIGKSKRRFMKVNELARLLTKSLRTERNSRQDSRLVLQKSKLSSAKSKQGILGARGEILTPRPHFCLTNA